MRLEIAALETKTVTVQGGRLYYESGDGRINFRMVGGGDARDFNLYAGQGFVCNAGERFYALEIKNIENFDQEIEIEISDREVFDNRARIVASGDLLPVVVSNDDVIEVVVTHSVSRGLNKATIAAGVATKLLNLDLARVKAVLYFVGDCYLGIDNGVTAANGFPVSSGSDLVDENTAELWVYSVAGCTVNVLEDRR